MDQYNAASSSSSQQNPSLKSQHASHKFLSEVGSQQDSQSLHRQQLSHHHPLSNYHHQHSHHDNKTARSTLRHHNQNRQNSTQFEVGSSEPSEQLTLKPPATFSDLNPMSEMLSSFHGSPSSDNKKLVRSRQTPNNPSATVSSNKNGSEGLDHSKSTEFSNTSVESLVSIK